MNGFFGPDVSPSGSRVIRKVLPELRIALKRRQHIKKGHMYEKEKQATHKKRTHMKRKNRQHIKKDTCEKEKQATPKKTHMKMKNRQHIKKGNIYEREKNNT